MPDSLSTVLFDLDDTLLDSFDARFKTLQSVLSRANITHPTAEQFLRSLNGRKAFLKTIAVPTGQKNRA